MPQHICRGWRIIYRVVPSFYCVGPGEKTQAVSLDKCLYLGSHLTSLWEDFSEQLFMNAEF